MIKEVKTVKSIEYKNSIMALNVKYYYDTQTNEKKRLQ